MPAPPPNPLYHRFDGYDELKGILDGSDEDVLVALAGKPALIRIPGLDDSGTTRARFISCLLHGNEDSGFRAVVDLLRSGGRWPFDLWVLIGNVRAASTDGWFAHRYLDDQEDFNRVWGLGRPTTRMRRAADRVMDELPLGNLEAALDLHNNTGTNPYYAITPRRTDAALRLALTCADIVLHWGQRAYTLMEALIDWCPAIAVECGLPGRHEHTEYAVGAVQRFLDVASFEDGPIDFEGRALYELRYKVHVRPEVAFAFGGVLTEDLDLVLRPGLDSHNFGMLLAGTELGWADPGTAMPLVANDIHGTDATDRFLAVAGDGRLIVTEDVTPAMMTTAVEQTRRDCLFYVARRCA